FIDVHPLWLRDGLQYFLGMQMQTGALSMASARSYLISIRKFGRYLQGRGVQHPRLAEDREALRDLVLGWRGEVASMRSERTGGPLSKSTAYQYLNQPENLYGWLLDHRADLARAVEDDRWLALGIEHSRFYQPGERPRTSTKAPDEDEVIEDAVMTRVLSVAGELGRDVSDGGAGDQQAERMLLLLAKTGRRVMEILQLDFEPLLPLAGGVSANDTDGFAAKLRYQQTKIEGAPDTILVDRETVAIIDAQQRWAREWLQSEGIDAEPKYLFMRPRMNRNGDRCYAYATFRQRLSWLTETHELKDSRGRPVVLTRTHRFRHTQATSLINAGVPLHVVQRYFGHLSPTMTMRYARTLAETHEREFLRYRKVTADGRQLDLDPRDLYDMLELDKRADRILPNGYCLLPPRQSCDRGNACLTCDKSPPTAPISTSTSVSCPGSFRSSMHVASSSNARPDARCPKTTSGCASAAERDALWKASSPRSMPPRRPIKPCEEPASKRGSRKAPHDRPRRRPLTRPARSRGTQTPRRRRTRRAGHPPARQGRSSGHLQSRRRGRPMLDGLPLRPR
ncbi:MAG: tyrosine-type recombinase/integrase, partial [Solirubrobacteraceae bacterium]